MRFHDERRTGFAGVNIKILLGVVLVVVSMAILIGFGGGYVFDTVNTVLEYMGWASAGELTVKTARMDPEASSQPFVLRFRFLNGGSDREVWIDVKGQKGVSLLSYPGEGEQNLQLKKAESTGNIELIYGDDSGEELADIGCHLTIKVKSYCRPGLNFCAFKSAHGNPVTTLASKRIDIPPENRPDSWQGGCPANEPEDGGGVGFIIL